MTWAKGQSGNPGGRPSLPEEFKGKGPEAFMEILRLMHESADEQVRLRAAQYIADRVYGKAAQAIDVQAEGLLPAYQALLASSKPSE